MELNNLASTDLQLCVDGVTFHVHRDVLVPNSQYVREFLRSPMTQMSPGDAFSVYISLPKLEISRDLCCFEVDALEAFEAFLSACYNETDQCPLRPHQLFEVAVIADFMISESILKVIDGYMATLNFTNQSWMAALIFCKRFQLPLTTQKLLKSQNIGLFQILTKSDLFFQFEENEILAILKNPNLPILIKIFAAFWFCTGLRDDEFGRKNHLQVKGDSKSAAFIRFMGDIIVKIKDRVTLEFLTNMTEKFELLSDTGKPVDMVGLYKMIARKALEQR